MTAIMVSGITGQL